MVFTSPLQRAARTCELAGSGAVAEIDPDLVEWNYGEYEDRRTADILKERPDWQLFREGCPGGESPEQVGTRADRVMSQVGGTRGDVLVFSGAWGAAFGSGTGSDSKRALPGGTSYSAQRA